MQLWYLIYYCSLAAFIIDNRIKEDTSTKAIIQKV